MASINLTLASLFGLAACTMSHGEAITPLVQPAPLVAIAVPASSTSGLAEFESGFNLPAPGNVAGLALRRVYSTTYYVPLAVEVPPGTGVPLRQSGGASLGASVTNDRFCDGAMEGTLLVRTIAGSLRRFNVSAPGSTKLADCTKRYAKMNATDPGRVAATGRMLFTEISPSSTPYGLGTSGACGEQRGRFRLVPHRSIAVDKTGALVPYGTVLYIERLRGAEIELPSGRKVQHDGYVQAVDTGGAIQGIHFDYFKGPSESDRPLQQLISSAESLVDVRVVSDPTITQTLCDYHLIPPAVAG